MMVRTPRRNRSCIYLRTSAALPRRVRTVELVGLEPTTLSAASRTLSQLSYSPKR